nr:hypothetical protein BgiMline_022409 [Biomphalaria glabrata]
MWTCIDLYAVTQTLLVVLIASVGGAVSPKKCLGLFQLSHSTYPVVCTNGSLSNVNGNSLTCQAKDFQPIEDFVLYYSTPRVGICIPHGGYNFKSTVIASCPNGDASTLVSSSNANGAQHQSSLNRVIEDVYLKSMAHYCGSVDVAASNVDICTKSCAKGGLAYFITLNDPKLISFGTRPSSCTCSIRASRKNITVFPIDVRSDSNHILHAYVDGNDDGQDMFKTIDGTKVFPTDILFITLKINGSGKPMESILIEITGDLSNISCGPEYENKNNTKTTLLGSSEPSTKFYLCTVAVPVLSFVALCFIISTIVFYHKYRNNVRNGGAVQELTYDHLNVQMDKSSEYEILEVIPTTSRC